MSEDLRLREAVPADVDLLVEMMAEFYAEASYPLNRRRARAAFDELLRNPALGRIWILREHDLDAGYLALTLAYSMEYGGLSAFIDDFYVRSEHRGRGLGQATLARVRDYAVGLGVRALHLEVGSDNHAAQAVYSKAGFAATDRQLLTLQLDSPTHVD